MLRGLLLLAPAVLGLSVFLSGAEPPIADRRTKAEKLMADGNDQEAYDVLNPLVLDPEHAGQLLADDYVRAIQCLQNLQRQHEIDAFREAAVTAHADDWRLLARAAEWLLNGEHYGFIVAGEFSRGQQRGGGQFADATQRDRVRALQLLEQARPLVDQDEDKVAAAQFYYQLASAVMDGRGGGEAWRLQALTDLTQLPDYEESQPWRGRRGWGGGAQGKGAPVDADGNPVLYAVPDSWEAATSDGERWRWALSMVAENQPRRQSEIAWQFANSLHSQFGVQTMQQWGIVLPQSSPGAADDVNDSGPYALHSLGEDETIARLATGVKRFKLPDEFNPVRIWQQLAAGDEQGYGDTALRQLAQVFEDRQQYVRAAQYWKESIDRFGDDRNKTKQARLNQVVGNWGRFENTRTQPAGQGAVVQYRFRNGQKLHLEAHILRVGQLLGDVQQYLKSNPRDLDWQKLQIDNIGQRLVQMDETKYRGERIAAWDVDLDPRPDHFDRRIDITTPLQRAGAYLIEATLADGNTSRTLVWLDDTAIVKKQLDGKAWYFVADAVTGKPVPGANVEFFGWRHEQVPNTKNQHRVVTSAFAEKTDNDGQVFADPRLLKSEFQWIAIARTRQGRFAHLGFSGAWYGNYHREEKHEVKVYFVSDRPVYRPAQAVQFKFWIRQADYEQSDSSNFANQKFTVVINDPQGVEVHQQEYTTDEFGGLAGEYRLPDEAPLGVYSAHVVNHGGGSFRVEEYKKPEFEVTVDAPDKPVMLGEKVTATINAKYYFGGPVTQATVKYKVQRTGKDARWYPVRQWDWLYGNGYWWFAADYQWYPGFSRWGCFAPIPPWWNWNPDPPELVLDQEVPIGPDGTVQVEIDTTLAKELHGDEDHEYTITAEVVDQSRRTIIGTGSVLVAREPFKVFTWTDRGYYHVGDTIRASFQARTPDGKPVAGDGHLKLLKITYDDQQQPVENVAQEWDLATDAQGQSSQQMTASEPGQYRLSYSVTAGPFNGEPKATTIEGGYVFTITGEGFDGSEFQFNDLELTTDKAEYAPGETVNLLINTNRVGSTVLLFVRPSGGVSPAPAILRLDGKSTTHEVMVTAGDMPNFFIEAITISGAEVHTVTREVIVPPEKRVLDVAVDPSAARYKPGEEATVKVRLTDIEGKPYKGSVVLSMYDRAVDAIAGGSNVPEIREFFWKWRRSFHAQTEHSLGRTFYNLLKNGEIGMNDLGAFGNLVADQYNELAAFGGGGGGRPGRRDMGMLGGVRNRAMDSPWPAYAPMMEMADGYAGLSKTQAGEPPGGGEMVQPTVRSQFADTAYWNAAITTGDDGTADVALTMPENLTGWKLRAWGMGHGTRVGEATTEVVTFKNLLVRLQAPRFFVETDEVVLSAIVHNYLETEKTANVELVLEGNTLELLSGEPTATASLVQTVTVPSQGEVRVDWRVKAVREGEAVVTMKALTDEESDAMQMKFPVFVHGMLKTESFSGVVSRDQQSGTIEINVPEERRPEQTRLEIRYSPTLAGAMVDALPYLADYPYGCTEQTLNRFLPTVITQNILQRMNLDLAAIKEKRTNLNAQEIGDDAERAADWQRLTKSSHAKGWNPVFDKAEVELMVKVGVRDLSAMQLSDGGWGWFSGYGEHSYPHTTAVVIHGLQVAQANGVALLPEVMPRGVEWLNRYQAEQVRLLKIGEEITSKKREANPGEQYRTQANDIDSLTYMVLVDAGQTDSEMQRFLYRDRTKLSLYSQAMFGLALHAIGATDQRDMVIRNISQFVKTDNENQTTYIDLPNHGGYWWYWYGDVIEANACYLKLLTKTNPQDPQCGGLVKYLLNNRRHATYWNSTRDTSVVIEALAEYLVASGEAEPDMLVEVVVDGEVQQTVEITPEVLFSYENSFVIEGAALTAGAHTIELRRKALVNGEEPTAKGKKNVSPDPQPSALGPLYYNAYLTNFTLEDHITAAGLEIKVGRKFYKLVQRTDATDLSQGALGQAIGQHVLKYDRVELANLDSVTSGDLVEVELEIDSKNDYEYVIFEDLKAAGFEPVETNSGYTTGGLGAYVEFRDEKVAFFLRRLARGKHSVSYRLHAEAPGKFSALPTRAYAMYAPELKANSDEIKVVVEDRPLHTAHIISGDAEYYLTGPQQASPPDGTFPAGTKVTVLREAGSYALVRSADGVEAYVPADAIEN